MQLSSNESTFEISLSVNQIVKSSNAKKTDSVVNTKESTFNWPRLAGNVKPCVLNRFHTRRTSLKPVDLFRETDFDYTMDAEIETTERLGGLLCSYRRAA
ncbi:hypothetical protein [Novipirellula artificiosorum]|uniref:Uncharacterized protein n=1 Tax=Novipirellula artificiosorum TaxID=2528016 RepID=A0A5C6DT23_9BACT|nr:hypothetical protein [Novipirellula artificiosorum]TWU38651.1 hypothetical protein Poly41_31280 [Novipirellula artificiosorum]